MTHAPAPSTGVGPLATSGRRLVRAAARGRARGTGSVSVMAAATVATVLMLVNGCRFLRLLLIVARRRCILAYRMHVLSVARVETGRRHFEQLAELHLSTLEALASAIDAKDQTRDVAHPAGAAVRRRRCAGPGHVAL